MKPHFTLLFLVGIILLAACGQQEDPPLAEEQENNQLVQVKNSDPTKLEDLSNTEIANHLANVASDVPSVDDAAAIVAGPYTVVGIDVDKDLDRSRVGTIKYSVSEALYHDPYGKTAIVVADADVMERIRGMGDKMAQGHPVQGFVDELAAIVGRYMPEFPIMNNPPAEPDQNKEILSDEEQQKLDDIEGEQSNHHDNRAE
ncbi:YhcN/YlaJ family sporulation lipoprotein [Oceanobacillus profundus]|uniref:YhcN/YlaJ family sporulation lipoprotein n=1 Tax=Oceanobacillus TaxID=182709 RepID=UPI000BA76066|nr:YhcN/YlaJ family sporulation lipoprotein [Oceanobacillus profundus]MBR3119994.1 YhcN/YlaJ family sporulation lipoprotein [Oceanobacillus sp.]MDO6449778.1 YhcN/YlaJ family sporulation lipoprotein [Oceanobacillus profundus]PAE30144.1 hypothetical protein CHI07_05515 [Paenibacillus sp. 7884-2]